VGIEVEVSGIETNSRGAVEVTNTSPADVSDVRARLVGTRNLFSVSELYHENSKITRSAPGMAQSAESIRVAPDGFKRYMHAPHVALPAPRANQPSSLWDVILQRRSCRTYSGESIGLESVSDLAFYALGLPGTGYRRCLPSAGGLGPLELYVAAMNVDGLNPGLYHYDVRSHSLTLLAPGDCRPSLIKATFIKEAIEKAAAVIILSGVFGRSKIKYGERAYRFVLLEVGHAMQNACLAATALGIGVCPIGGFIDDNLNDLLDVDGIEEAALYAVSIGVRA
jgi:SagB-type dehydrogenase family enzyme